MVITLTVNGMHCDHCQSSVQSALEGVDGVTAASVDLDGGSATVEGTADVAALIDAVSEAGYEAAA